MNNKDIVITAADYAELHDLISSASHGSARAQAEPKALADELKHADIVDSNQIPPDFITMNSRVLLHDLDTGERMELTLVLPAAAKKIAMRKHFRSLHRSGPLCSVTGLATNSNGGHHLALAG
ncbi:MAG: hypothetical protein ABI016_07450 [Chthoniobacterales bacterium]